MYRGHAGLSLLLFSPFMLFFGVAGADMRQVLLTCILMVAFSFAPDVDIVMRGTGWRTRHRGITHTFLFATVVGVLSSVTLSCFYGSSGWLMGFTAGFGGVTSHLTGDVITHGPLRPFYPLSNKALSYGFFKASNRRANNAMLVLGIAVFMISYFIVTHMN